MLGGALHKTIVLINLLVVALLAGGVGLQISTDRAETIDRAYDHANDLTRALAGHTRQVLGGLDLRLGLVAREFPALDISSDEDLLSLHELLVAQQSSTSFTFAYYVLDQQGRLLATSRTASPQSTDLASFAEFTVHQQDDDRGLYVGEPRIGQIGFALDRWTVNVSRRLEDAQGNFAGIVAAAISVDYLLAFYDTLRTNPGDVVGVINEDGVSIVRAPFHDDAPGQRMSDAVQYRSFSGDGEAGQFIGTSTDLDGYQRVVAYTSVPASNLLVYVGLDLNVVLGSWRQRSVFMAIFGALVSALFVALSYLMLRYLGAKESALLAEKSARAEVETVFRSISDAVVVLDRNWCFTYLNEEAGRLLQRDIDELPGKNMWEEFPEGVDTDAYREYHRAVRENRPVHFELNYEPLDVWFSIRVFPHDKGLTIYFQDITERIETEERLRQSQKMEAVGQLTGGVAHDFNNLLTVILGNTELLMEQLDSLPDERMQPLRRQAALVQQAGKRAAELTHRLLAFARKQPLKPQVVSINELIADTENLLRHTLTGNVEIELIRGSGLWKAMVDPAELQSAIINLAINARDAMPQGGRLTIETANVSVDRDYARQHELNPGQYIMVAVSDTGTGMSADVRKRAFEPFFTTKKEGKGSGLGLSMVYGFARQSGGQVKIYTEQEHGTSVRLYLPRAIGDTSPTYTHRREVVPANEPGRESILVVEDDELVRQFTVQCLQRLGYRVHACAEGAPALAALANPGEFDLLLTDVVLTGGMSGREVAERARALQGDLRVLYMSGYTENSIVHHGRLDPGVQLLDKPFTIAALSEKVREVLDQPLPGDVVGS